MLKQEQEDERWLNSIGVTLEPKPEAMVSGKRYAELVDRNDELTTLIHNQISEVNRLRKDRDGQIDRAIGAEERVVFWRIFSVAALAVAAAFCILWGCRP